MLSTRVTLFALLAATYCLTSEAEPLYDVACPGINSELQCPAGHMIEVIEMTSGVMSDANCTDRKQPASVSDANLFHRSMIIWASFICNNLERCRLPMPNKTMFVGENTDNNFVQIAFNCHPKPAGLQTTVTCENQSTELECESGEIKIVTAKFGRFDENTCTKTPVNLTFAASYSARKHVKEECDGCDECTVTASSDHLGQPVPKHDLPMYLIVDYLCV